MVDPSNHEAVAELEKATSWTIIPAIAVRGELQRVVGAMYGPAGLVVGEALGVEIAADAGEQDATTAAAP